MNYSDWLLEFEKDKTFLTTIGQSSIDAVFDIRRYMDSSKMIWEIGITYTDRLVVRQGSIAEDEITILWAPWRTHHDIELHQKNK